MPSCWKSVGFFHLEPDDEMLLFLQWAQLICTESAALVWENGLLHTWWEDDPLKGTGTIAASFQGAGNLGQRGGGENLLSACQEEGQEEIYV